jgi:uncharacterized OB-fold protein
MERGFAKVAAYRPAGRADGVPRAGWDEDALTMSVAAIELLAESSAEVAVPGRILLVGPFPSTAEANLARFFGSAIPIERSGTGSVGLTAALRTARDAPSAAGTTLLLAADVAADSPDTRSGVGPTGPDGAIAAWSASVAGIDVPPPIDPGNAHGATALFFEWHRARGREPPERWVGGWEVPPSSSAASAGASRPRPTIPPGGPVSQGAYVPMPRYEENLPSRWRFAAEKCSACGALTFPERRRCRVCGRSEGLVRTYLPRDGGLVVATTTIGPGGQPTEFDEQVLGGGPYEVILVELVPEVRVTLQLTDATPGSVRIGDRVRTSLRRLYPMEGEWRYGRKATRGGPG